MSTSPAAASGTYHGGTYVHGSLKVDEMNHASAWNDEGVVSRTSNTRSNATCLWQKILWADGLLPASGIDGVFGADTAYATTKWQMRTYYLAEDGSAGRLTWTWAGYALVDMNHDGKAETYDGTSHDIKISASSSGTHYFWDGKGVKRAAGYNYNTCS